MCINADICQTTDYSLMTFTHTYIFNNLIPTCFSNGMTYLIDDLKSYYTVHGVASLYIESEKEITLIQSKMSRILVVIPPDFFSGK